MLPFLRETLYTQGGLTLYSATVLLNELPSLLWEGTSDKLHTSGIPWEPPRGHLRQVTKDFGVPFFNFFIPYLEGTCWVMQAITWEASHQNPQQRAGLGDRCPVSIRPSIATAVTAILSDP